MELYCQGESATIDVLCKSMPLGDRLGHEIIDGILNYIEDYIEELIKCVSPYEYSVGDIDSEDITDLVTGDEFLEKFKKWYLND